MKDLGEILKNNIDQNQKHVKDHTKPVVFDGGVSPSKASKKRFKKIREKINIESIPGSHDYNKKK